MSPDPKIGARNAQSQIAEHHLVEKGRQARIVQTNFSAIGIEFETERGLEQGEWRRARPGLRRTCNWIERWSTSLFAPEAAEQFGQSAQVHVGCSVKQRLEQKIDRMLEAVTREPKGDQRIVVRPDRSVMIGHWIVTRFTVGHSADAPAGEEVGLHQPGSDQTGTVLAHD